MSLCTTLALIVGLYTTHPAVGDFNEDNDLIGVRCNNFTYLNFTNSYNRLSNFGGYVFEYDVGSYVHVGATVGLVTGYENILGASPAPFALPYISVGDNVSLILTGVPYNMTHVALQISW